MSNQTGRMWHPPHFRKDLQMPITEDGMHGTEDGMMDDCEDVSWLQKPLSPYTPDAGRTCR